MSAARVARISATVDEVLLAPGDGRCATIEVVGRSEAWAQVMKGSLNISYPFKSPPTLGDVVGELPGVSIASWEAGNFVTFSFKGASADAVANTIDRLFTKYFACGDYSVECDIEDLHG